MSAIDYLHTTPEDRYEAVSVANDLAGGRSRFREFLRDLPGIIAILAVAFGLIALRAWFYMPASFHFHG